MVLVMQTTRGCKIAAMEIQNVFLSFQPFLLLVVLLCYCQGAYSGLSAAAQAGIEAQTAGILASEDGVASEISLKNGMGTGLEGWKCPVSVSSMIIHYHPASLAVAIDWYCEPS